MRCCLLCVKIASACCWWRFAKTFSEKEYTWFGISDVGWENGAGDVAGKWWEEQ